MALRVSGKNLDIGDALRERVTARLAEAASRHVDGRLNGHVTFETEAHGFRALAALHMTSGTTLQAEAFGADGYAAADLVVERVEKRLRRYGRRLKDKSGAPVAAFVAAPEMVFETPRDDVHEASGSFEPVVVAEQTAAMRRMTVAEAVMELDLTGAPALVFQHAAHGRVNIVYRRSDGHVGWIDPPARAA